MSYCGVGAQSLVSARVLGFRHGLDSTTSQPSLTSLAVHRGPVHAMKMGLMYAIGHALTVVVLVTKTTSARSC